MDRIVFDNIIDALDFADIDMCLNYIKGKQIKATRLGTNMATEVLELIITDICGSFPMAYLNGQ